MRVRSPPSAPGEVVVTPTIQVAFQGGGARLLAMLPIAHAISDVNKAGRVSVVGLSGTSAGAACAALVAAGADFHLLRKDIIKQGPSLLASLVPPPLQRLIDKLTRFNVDANIFEKTSNLAATIGDIIILYK